MKQLVLSITILFTIVFVQAQEQKVVTEYYDLVSINKNHEGNIKMQGNIDNNGFAVGKWKHYLKDGTLKYIIDHDKNISREYYKTGELKTIGAFNPDTGEHLGKWISYNKKGEIIAKEVFNIKNTN